MQYYASFIAEPFNFNVKTMTTTKEKGGEGKRKGEASVVE